MNTIELIEDAVAFGGTVPNDRIEEVREFINDLKSKALNIQNVSGCSKDENLVNPNSCQFRANGFCTA